jgi:hypothetical protein
MLIVLLAVLIKLPIAALMLWMPFHNDDAMSAQEFPGPADEDGGSKALPGGPMDPRPRTPLPRAPRRGPHGSPGPAAPPRIRTPVTAISRRHTRIAH